MSSSSKEERTGDDVVSNRKLEGYDFWRTVLNSAKLVVAPMVDQSELAWRMLSRKYKAQLCYTPMYHSSVFVRDERYRKEALASCKDDRPLIIQFCGNDPDTFLKAAQYAEAHCDAVDINLGCPQQIAKRGHYGAFLQDEWVLLHKIVSLCHEKLKVPITAKIRVFSEVEKTIRYAKMLEKAGCQLLTVHGRTKEQKGPNTGMASWAHIKAVKETLKIPVFANGNIQYLEDVNRCLEETGVDGVMSAEGNLHNPALFTGEQYPVWQMAEEYLEMTDTYPCPLSYIRGHIFKIMHHSLLVHTDARDKLATANSVHEIRTAVSMVKEASKKDVEAYEKGSWRTASKLPFPYWICQPYVRPPKKEESDTRSLTDSLKRIRDEDKNSAENGGLSKNKLKKLRRNPSKRFEPKTQKFEKCEGCGNPKGLKCNFSLCKSCCKKKCFSEKTACSGHGFFPKNGDHKKEEGNMEPSNANENEQTRSHSVAAHPENNDSKISGNIVTLLT